MKNLDRRTFLELSAAGTLGLTLPGLGCRRTGGTDERPNIIVIMADDMGFSDPGCYGGEIRTPNIDRLASNGLRFTRFYNAARCCPTRASMMTGLYPHQVNMATNGNTLGRRGITIAEGLGEAGYNTAMLGKWHLSKTLPMDDTQKQLAWLNHQLDPDRPFSPIDSYPVNRGFDRYYGAIWGVVDYFDPFSLVEGTEPVEEVPDDYYFTDALNRRSVETIRELGQRENPYFLYLAHAAPHWPLHAREEDIARYEHTYDGGWNQMRRERFRRQVEMGMFEEGELTLPPVQDQEMEWDTLSDDRKEFMADKMAAHAAMVDRLDQGIGMILDTLEETGQLENTMILFLSDNGASPETPVDWGPGFDRPSETRGGKKIRYEGFDEAGPETTYAGIGPAWASAGNTPFRYWKAEQYEGGAHTPCIVHWPGGLKTEPGTVSYRRGHVMDILPTCLELAEADYPSEYNGHRIHPMEGESLVPVLQGEESGGHEKLFFEHVGGKAAMIGDWKLVTLRRGASPWRLYNLAEDPTETNDLADRYPERVEAMKKEWVAWADRIGFENFEID